MNDDNDKTIAELTEAIGRGPKNADAYRKRGYAYFKTDDSDNAIADYTKAIELDPNNKHFYSERGAAYLQKNDYERAIADFTQTIELDANYATAYGFRGMAYYARGDYKHAIADCMQALVFNPNDKIAQQVLEYAFEALDNGGDREGELNRVIAECTEAIERDPNNADAYFKRGMAYSKKDDYDHALEDLTKAVKLNPNDIDNYDYRGQVYYNKHDYQNALKDCNKIIELKPDCVPAYSNRGLVYCDTGDYERAIADFTRAVEFNPNYIDAYNNRGSVYFKKGDYERAIADYIKALKLVPNYKKAKRGLKEAMYAKGDAGSNAPFYATAPVYEFDVDFRGQWGLMHYNAYRPEREEFFAAVARDGKYFQYQLGPCERLIPKSYSHLENNTGLDKRIKDFMRDNDLSCCETLYPNALGGFTYVVNYSFDKHKTFGFIDIDSTQEIEVAKIDELLRNIQFDKFYLEATFQFKLLMQLAKIYDEDDILPERSIAYYTLQGLTKKEIDIVLEQGQRTAFELKMPMNGQVPEQMFKFVEDIKFLEELKASGLFTHCFLIVVTSDSNFWQGAKQDGIYAPFRTGSALSGKIYKPTGDGKDTVYHQLNGEYKIEWKTLENNFRYFVVEV